MPETSLTPLVFVAAFCLLQYCGSSHFFPDVMITEIDQKLESTGAMRACTRLVGVEV
jgi:hypothetical protein